MPNDPRATIETAPMSRFQWAIVWIMVIAMVALEIAALIKYLRSK